jgi:sugar/nucleoside kinase (ribokinase family)
MTTRQQIACSAADRLEGAEGLPPALVGFDGFIDSILDVVDLRHDMSPGGYEPIRTIPALAARIGGAAGRSMNLEIVEREERWGGNGPLMAGVLAALGSPVTYIGAVGGGGNPPHYGVLHPAYKAFAARCARVLPIAEPARTRALEFADGKVMLNEPLNVQAVTWERIIAAAGGIDGLREMVRQARLLGLVNWSLLGGMDRVLLGLAEEVFEASEDAPLPRVFVDLTDPAKRTDQDVRGVLAILARMNRRTPVTLGLNLAEAERISGVVGGEFPRGGGPLSNEALAAAAAGLRERLELSCLVVHRHRGAVAAAVEGGGESTAMFDAPWVSRPRISTGAGDHFSGGFALAQSAGLTLGESLAAGCAVAGLYVREARAPERDRLVDFLRNLPQPEGVGE